MKLIERLMHHAGERGGQTALTWLSSSGTVTELSFERLYRAVRRRQFVLLEKGLVRPGGRYMVAYEADMMDFIKSFLAVMACGATAAPFKPDRVIDAFNHSRRIATHCQAEAVLATDAALIQTCLPGLPVINCDQVEAAVGTGDADGSTALLGTDNADKAAAADADLPHGALLLYTSGSTNEPKGVEDQEDSLCYLLDYFARAIRRDEHSVTLCWMPLYHGLGMVTLMLMGLWSGGRTILLQPEEVAVDPALWLLAADLYKVTHTSGPNYFLSMLTKVLQGENAQGVEERTYDLSTIRNFILTTEFIQPDTVRQFLEAAARTGFDGNALGGGYGLTETGSCVAVSPFGRGMSGARLEEGRGVLSSWNVTGEAFPDAPVILLAGGSVIEGYDLVILDTTRDEPLPEGMVGEICLAGPSVIPAYMKDAEGHAPERDSFVWNGRSYLRSGDLGFFMQDENGRQEIFVCGRKKEWINLKGEKYSPSQLEAMVTKAVGEDVLPVAVSVPAKDTESLIILLEEQRSFTDDERQQLTEAVSQALLRRVSLLPDAVVFSTPRSFLRTITGKLRRLKMRESWITGTWPGRPFYSELTGAADSEEEVTPCEAEIRSFLEKYVEGYSPACSSDTTLLSLGLSSLLWQLLIAHLRKCFQVQLSLQVIRDHPSIGALARYVSAQLAHTADPRGPKQAAAGGAAGAGEAEKDLYLPMNPLQRAYLAGRNREMDWGGVACQYYFERSFSDLDPERLHRALQILSTRHRALRATIAGDRLKILPQVDVPLTIQQAEDPAATERLIQKTREEMRGSMLGEGSLLYKIVLTRTDAATRSWLAHLQLDMIAFDAMSIHVFWDLLMNALEADGEPAVPSAGEEDPMVFASRVPPEKQMADKLYWEDKLATIADPPQLPWSMSGEKTIASGISRLSLKLDDQRWQALRRLSDELGITPTVFFLTLFTELLSGFGGGEAFTLMLTTSGRDMASDAQSEAIGEYTRLLLASLRRRDVSVLQNARSISQELMKDLDHLDHSSFDIVRGLRRLHDKDGAFPVVFTSLLGMEQLFEHFPFEDGCYGRSSTPQVVLDHQLLPVRDGVIVCWDYVPEAFLDGIPGKMFEVYSCLIDRALERGFWEQTLRDLRPESDRHVQEVVNDTQSPIPSVGLLYRFRQLVKESGHRTAIIAPEGSFTYAELAARADRVSHLLTAHGVVAGDRVVIRMEKSIDLIAAIIAVVQAGGVYVPMPHDQPDKRLADICRQAGARVMLGPGEAPAVDGLDFIDIAAAAATATAGAGAGEDEAGTRPFEPVEVDPASLAYIIYTSGSTGVPKGVAITHDAAMNTILAVDDYLRLTPEDRLIGLSAVSFDLSVYDIFATLNKGACLVVPSEAERVDPSRWVSLCATHRVTVWNTVPALMDLMLDYCLMTKVSPGRLRVREVILSGDWIPMNLFAKLREVMPAARLTSMGGATEASIWSNYYPVTFVDPTWRSIPYGHPLPNQLFHVLDEAGRLAPAGVSGRLFIGGRGLASCYYNDPERTAASFIIHSDTGERLYDTGDYGRYEEDGTLIFLGRKDTQVKINGYRIELGEIQSALSKTGYPENVISVSGEGQNKKLLAFARVADPERFDEAAVRTALEGALPHYFMPARIIPLAAFPMTANGKVDQKTLLKEYQAGAERQAGAAAAEELSEQDREIIALLEAELGRAPLCPSDELDSLGVNSLALIRLANALENRMGYRAGMNEIIRYRRIDDFLSYYQRVDKAGVEAKQAELAAREEAEAAAGRAADPLYDHPVMTVLREELGLPAIRPEDDLAALGLTSLTVIRIANRFENLYGLRPTVHELARYQTVRDVLDFFDKDRGQRQTLETADLISESATEDPVLQTVERLLHRVDLKREDSFASLGTSSLEIIRVANQLEHDHGYGPSVQELVAMKDLGDLIDFYDPADAEERRAASLLQPREEKTRDLVLGCLENMLHKTGLTREDSFAALGTSSLEIIRVANQLEGLYGNRPSIQEMVAMKDFGELVDHYKGVELLESRGEEEDRQLGTAINLFNRCKDADIMLWPEGDKLKFKAPKGALTPELKEEISSNKAALLAYLAQRDTVTSQELTPLQMAYVVGRQNNYVLGDVTAHYYVEYEATQLDLDRLNDAVNELIVKNEILRTIITPEGRMKVYHNNPGFKVEVLQLSSDEEGLALREQMKNHRFVLGEWPMFDVKAAIRPDGRTTLHIEIDCLILDGWSINMFIQQLATAYNGGQLQVSSYTFRRYLEEERQWLRNKVYYRDAQNYWNEQIKKLPPAPHLPLKTPLSEIKDPLFKRMGFKLSQEKTFAFFRRLARYELTPALALCTAYMMSLSKWSSNKGVTLNLTMFNRQPIHPDVHKVLGDFTNIALVSCREDSGKTFLEKARAVGEELLNAIEYRSFNVINLLGVMAENHGDEVAAPYVFTSLIDRESEDSQTVMERMGLKEIDAQTQTPQVVLDHQLYISNGQLLLSLDYVDQAFDQEMLEAFFRDYTSRVERLADEEDWEGFQEPAPGQHG